MFKFGFDLDTGEANIETEDTGAKGSSDIAEFAEHHNSDKEGINSSKVNAEVKEVLGVKYYADLRFEDEVFAKTEAEHSDLIPKVYEGGYKVWECTYDVLSYLKDNNQYVKDKVVLDLGCGAGLIGFYAALNGAKEVHFQDYNDTVIQHLTISNSRLNVIPTCRYRFFSGDWSLFRPDTKYDLIITSETIYRKQNYPLLTDLFTKYLTEDGCALVACKSVYFGVGGTSAEFKEHCEGVDMTWDVLWSHDQGVPREIIKVAP